jgi:hypothetical protein
MGAALRVAVVGRSACTSDAARVAELVGAELCRAGHTVLVSFGYGVAAAALRAAADQAACGYGPPPAAFAAHHNGRVLVGGLLREMDEQLARWHGAGQIRWHYTEPGYRPPAHAAALGRLVFVPAGVPGDDVAGHTLPARLLADAAARPFLNPAGLCAELAALPTVVGEGA